MKDPYPNCCRWIDGDVKSGTGKWCEQPADRGGTWCADHRRVVYVETRPSRQKSFVADTHRAVQLA